MKLLRKAFDRLGFVHKSQIPSWKDEFLNGLNPMIAVPFNGDPILVRVRPLSHVDIKQAGNFSLIETLADKRRIKNIKPRQIKEYADTQLKLIESCLVSPSLDDIMGWAAEVDWVKEKNKQYHEIRELLSKAPSSLEKKKLENELDQAYIASKLVLPEDFIGAVVSYALGAGKTDIKKVTEDMLLEAAIKAERGHDNPSDHIHGVFSEFNKEDINNRAWTTLDEHKKKMRSTNGGRRR